MKHLASDLVERFHRVLVEEVRRNAPGYLTGAFTVAEIYQTLVPYRTHRDRIGVEMNGDYEDALMRLLSGEGGLLTLESDSATEQIRRELRTANPNTGLYREFAALGVRLNPEAFPADLSIPEDEAEAGSAERGDEEDQGFAGWEASEPSRPSGFDLPPLEGLSPIDLSDAPADAEESSTSDLPGLPASFEPELSDEAVGAEEEDDEAFMALLREDGPPNPEPTPRAVEEAPSTPSECPECKESLPSRDGLRFCPFCGTNVFVTACGQCGEVLEREWAYCVACGVPAR